MGQERAEGTRLLPINALAGRSSPFICAGGGRPHAAAAALPRPTPFRTSAGLPPPQSLPIVWGGGARG